MTSQGTGDLKARVCYSVKLARALRGLTQLQMANLVGVDPMQVSKWERGIHRPDDENLAALAAGLSFDLSWFYEDHAAEPEAA